MEENKMEMNTELEKALEREDIDCTDLLPEEGKSSNAGLIVTVVCVIAGAAAGAWYWMKKKKAKKEISVESVEEIKTEIVEDPEYGEIPEEK